MPCPPHKYLLFLSFILITLFSFTKGAIAGHSSHPFPYSLDLEKGVSIELNTEAGIASDDSIITLPFSRAGNLILVKGMADSIEGNFVLDTGSPHLVLNLTYFRHYPITFDQEAEKNGMTGIVENATQTKVRNFSFGGIKHYQLEADLVNLGHIENSRGVKILGLLGVQLFKQHEIIIDFERNLIFIHQANGKNGGSPSGALQADTSYHTLPIELVDNRIIVKSEIGGKKVRFIIDSGAEINIIDSRLPDKIYEQVLITGRVLIAGVGHRKVEALQGDLRNLKIGGRLIESMPVVVTNLEKTCFSNGGCADGILGFEFLSLQKIGFNFVKRKLYIWK